MRIFVFAIIALSLIAVNVFSTTLPNESAEDYKERYKKEFILPQTICGDGLCEGREFETCAQDCKKVPEFHENKSINEPTISQTYDNPIIEKKFNFKVILILILGVAALGVIIYILWKRKIRDVEEDALNEILKK